MLLGLSCWYSTPAEDGVLCFARFSRFMSRSMFSGASFAIIQSQLISIDSLKCLISLLKQISTEDFGSKS